MVSDDLGSVCSTIGDAELPEIDYTAGEVEYVRKYPIDDVLLEFQKGHVVEVVRGPDYAYECYIDKVCYAVGLTFAYALRLGIHNFGRKA